MENLKLQLEREQGNSEHTPNFVIGVFYGINVIYFSSVFSLKVVLFLFMFIGKQNDLKCLNLFVQFTYATRWTII